VIFFTFQLVRLFLRFFVIYGELFSVLFRLILLFFVIKSDFSRFFSVLFKRILRSFVIKSNSNYILYVFTATFPAIFRDLWPFSAIHLVLAIISSPFHDFLALFATIAPILWLSTHVLANIYVCICVEARFRSVN
jgi:hypothetical protein